MIFWLHNMQIDYCVLVVEHHEDLNQRKIPMTQRTLTVQRNLLFLSKQK